MKLTPHHGATNATTEVDCEALELVYDFLDARTSAWPLDRDSQAVLTRQTGMKTQFDA